MKRDIDLLRSLLLAIEGCDGPTNVVDLHASAADFPTLAAHAALLVEAGLIEAEVAHADGVVAPIYVNVHRLTWRGHEFLDNARNPETWAKARAFVADSAGTTSFEILAELLANTALVALGLRTR